MDKLYTFIQKTPNAQKVAALALVMAMIVGGHYWFVYRGQSEDLVKQEQALAKLEEELQEKQEIAGNLSMFKKKVEFLQQKLEEKKKNLPDDANMDQLLKTLNELSEKSDIRIVKFTPKPEVRQNFYAEIPVAMEIQGNYHEITTFFDKVAKEDRIINITSIVMKNPKEKSGKIVLDASCLAKTFRALPPQEQQQAAAGAQQKK
jgi:type IV pilus assembly protein PilO